MWLIVGLGNPGPEYEGNRHNLGFLVLDELLKRGRGGPLKAKLGAQIGEGIVGGQRALFCKPMEYMNVSGQAVARVAGFWKIPAQETVVVHDELDLLFGRLKIGVGGGPGGHNGVKSLISTMGPGFARVRIGIGRPAAGRDPADWVLSDFSRAEQAELPELIADAAAAVDEIVARGTTSAMNKFNTKKKPRSGEDA
jgi:PTH1 family peptidyl-tRNA hydrolase